MKMVEQNPFARLGIFFHLLAYLLFCPSSCVHVHLVARVKIPVIAALLTTGLVQECLKQSLHGAPPERSSAQEKASRSARKKQLRSVYTTGAQICSIFYLPVGVDNGQYLRVGLRRAVFFWCVDGRSGSGSNRYSRRGRVLRL